MNRTATRDTFEDWLARTIAADKPIRPPPAGHDVAQLLSAARRQGVVALLRQRLQEADDNPALTQAVAAAARDQAALSLYQTSQCRRILACLEQAGLPVLVLKGTALAQWAYASPHLRARGDIDLLLRSRADVDRAICALHDIGCRAEDTTLPGDLVAFELTCMHNPDASNALEIDLHWQLSSTPMFAFRLGWEELRAAAIALPDLAPQARGLAPAHAYVHACMHRIQNLADGRANTLKWLLDLIMVGRQLRSDEWQTVAQLGVERGVAGVLLDGAHAAESRFGECMPLAVRQTLQTAAAAEHMDITRMHQWWYLQRMNLAAYPQWPLKLRWLRQRLLPDRAYLLQRYGGGLVAAMRQRGRAGVRRWRG